MRKVIVHEYVSADGFASGVDGNLDWAATIGGEVDQLMLRELEGIDLIVLGALTYELFAQYWPTPQSKDEVIADRLNATPKLVFSTTLQGAPWGTWPAARLDSSGNAAMSVAGLKQTAGASIVVWGSLSLAGSLLDSGVVDEVWLGVTPVVLGDGRRLFPHGTDLELIGAQTFADSGIAMLRYRMPR